MLYTLIRSILILALLFSFRVQSQGEMKAETALVDTSYQEAYLLYNRDNRDDRESAIQLFEIAAYEFKNLKDYIRYSDCLVKQAILLTKLKEYSEAGKILLEVEPVLDNYIHKEDSLYSDFYSAKASYLWETTKSREALDYFQLAIDIRTNLGLLDNTLSFIYNNMGSTYYYYRDYTRTIDCFEHSIDLKEKNLLPDDPKLSSSYINFGSMIKELGRYEEAIEYILKGANLYDPDDKTHAFGLGAAYNSLGLIYDQQADFQKAIDYYQSAIRSFERLGRNYLYVNGNIHNNLGFVYMKLKDYPNALKWLFSSLEIKNLTKSGELSSTYLNIAETYRQLGNHTEASTYFLKAIDYTIELKGEENVDLAIYYLNYGMYLLDESNDPEKGMNYYRKALALCLKNFGEKHPRTSRAYFNIGKYYDLSDNLDSALLFTQKSIISLVTDFQDLDYRKNPDIHKVSSYVQLLNSIKEKAALTESRYNKSGTLSDLYLSFSTLEKANIIIEEIRTGVQNETSRMILAQNEYSTYQKIIQLALQIFDLSGDPTYQHKAFEYSEKSKSANLLAALRNTEAKEIGGIPEELVAREQALMRDLNSYKLFVHEEKEKENPDEDRIKIVEDNIFSLQKQLDILNSSFEETYPEYYALKFNTAVADHSEIANILEKDEALIEYVVLDSLLFSFLHTRKDFIVRQIAIDSIFHFNTRFVREMLTSREFSEGVKMDYTQFVHASYNLYNILIRPIEPSIKDCKLVIIPDESLAYIPFEVLLSGLPEYQEPDYKGLPYLFLDHSISYSNSATLLVNKSNRKEKTNRRLLAFAPEYQNRIDSENKISSREELFNNLYPIPGVVEEVSFIRDLIRGNVFMDSEATESNFKANSPNYGILHFAMHTVIDDVNPMYSKLVFSNTSQEEEDGFLNTFEIYNLSLNAKLAVLSSCNSGTGKMQKGEGVMSLARGFIYAGCPSIIMTLWEVEDNSGSEIMSGFYTYLKKGYAKNDALRYAKLDFLETATMETSHPYFWSGYVNIGNTEPIFQKSLHRIIGLIFIFSMVAVIGGLIYKKLR